MICGVLAIRGRTRRRLLRLAGEADVCVHGFFVAEMREFEGGRAVRSRLGVFD